MTESDIRKLISATVEEITANELDFFRNTMPLDSIPVSLRAHLLAVFEMGVRAGAGAMLDRIATELAAK